MIKKLIVEINARTSVTSCHHRQIRLGLEQTGLLLSNIELDSEKQREKINHLPPTLWIFQAHICFFVSSSSPSSPQASEEDGAWGLQSLQGSSSLLLCPLCTFPCSSTGPLHALQSFRINLHQHRSITRPSSYQNRLQCRLFMCYRAFRIYLPPWAAVWISVLPWPSPWAAGKYQFHYDILQGLQGSLCSGWRTSSPPSLALVSAGLFLSLFFLTPHIAMWPFALS